MLISLDNIQIYPLNASDISRLVGPYKISSSEASFT